MRDEYKILAEAYTSIYNKPEQISINEGDLMLDLVSRITSSFTTFYPVYNPIQEGTIKFVAQKWSEGLLKKELLERTLERARTQNNKSVDLFLTYMNEGLYDGTLKSFVSENILPSLFEEKKEKHVFAKVEKAAEKAGYSKKSAEKIAGAAKAKAAKKKK